jgi:pimeloyl-ACP methyl ester carboxylesterase
MYLAKQFTETTRMRIIKRILQAFFVILVLLALVYVLGPRPDEGNLLVEAPVGFSNPEEAANYLQSKENALADRIRLDNEARIIWSDTLKQKTPYSIVYLHGFGASQGEGLPVHQWLADTLGANLFLARLDGHGRSDREAMEGLKAKDLMKSAWEAIEIGAALGNSVIVIGTSTGGALALWAAPKVSTVSHVLLYSPIIRPYSETSARQLVGPWGKQLMSLLAGGPFIENNRRDSVLVQYWSTYYHVDAYEALMQFVYSEMVPEKLSSFNLPLFLAYYYKNEQEQDMVVSVPAMLEMMEWVGTPESKKLSQAFPESGNHVIASEFRSADWRGVAQRSLDFLLQEGAIKLPDNAVNVLELETENLKP